MLRAILIFGLIVSYLPCANAVSLEEAYHAALTANEDVAFQAETVKQAEERYSQAKGALFPTVNGVATYLRQDSPPAGTASSISPSEQKTIKISAIQPLFRGLREWAALKRQRVNTETAELGRQQALMQIFSDISLNYYLSLMAEQDFKNLQVEIDVNQKRLDELQSFKRLGRSRASEVLSQQANIAILDAQIDAAQFTVENSRAALSLLTGIKRQAVLVDEEKFPARIAALEEYLSKIENRPDVKAAKRQVEASDQGISIARGGHLPSLDLGANYYLVRPDGYLKDVKWDLQLSLTFPIFQGGVVQSETEIAVSQMKQSELALAKLRRSASEEIETLFIQARNDLMQIEKQKKAVDLTEENYQAERKDYRNGLVTNIEVLTALTTSQQTRRNLDKIQYQFKMNYMRLLAATAERPSLDTDANSTKE
jgi:outer membrane protein